MRKTSKTNRVITPPEPLKIDRLTPTGQGIATGADGLKIFLWNALPGELVSAYRETKTRAHLKEGIATEFAATSPDRIAPLDDHFLSTSPWQILSEPAEMTAKEALLSEIFRPLAAHFPDHLRSSGTVHIPLVASPNNYFYRNKMEYSLYFDHADGQIHLATHLRGTHIKIPITTSSIERPEIFTRAKEIIAELNARGDEARRYQSLILRCNQTGKVSGGLYENGRPHPTFDNLEDTLLGHRYSYSVGGFFQINLPAYELALTEIKRLLDPSLHRVTDLYSGVGTIGLSVARDRDLTLVEVDKSAYAELERNVASITAETPATIQPVLAKSEEALDFITADSAVILDPPRAGCHDALIQRLIDVHPREIIYLSCNPATQVRDLERLLTSGKYSIRSATAYNFFPRTPHIENLISLWYNN